MSSCSSSPRGLLSIETLPAEVKKPRDFKKRWKNELLRTIATTRLKLAAAQARYKRNFDERLRLQTERIRPGAYVFLRVERKNEKDTRQKLAPVAEGPFLVKSIDKNTATKTPR